MDDDRELELRLEASQAPELYCMGSLLRSTFPELHEGLGADLVKLMLHLTVLPSGPQRTGGVGTGTVAPTEAASVATGSD